MIVNRHLYHYKAMIFIITQGDLPKLPDLHRFSYELYSLAGERPLPLAQLLVLRTNLAEQLVDCLIQLKKQQSRSNVNKELESCVIVLYPNQ